jgi:heme exporter protein D
MTYLGYVAAAYAVFAIVMSWDMLAPALRIRRTLRDVLQRARRAAAKTAPPSTDLHR